LDFGKKAKKRFTTTRPLMILEKLAEEVQGLPRSLAKESWKGKGKKNKTSFRKRREPCWGPLSTFRGNRAGRGKKGKIRETK